LGSVALANAWDYKLALCMSLLLLCAVLFPGGPVPRDEDVNVHNEASGPPTRFWHHLLQD